VTPHGAELLFELGGYAYLWWDGAVSDKTNQEKLAWHFPSVDEAYTRISWTAGALLVGVRKGEIVVHAGGHAVLIQPGATTNNPVGNKILNVTDDGRHAVIRCDTNSGISLTTDLDRQKMKLVICRSGSADWQFWCQGDPRRRGNQLSWQNGTTLVIREGRLADWSPHRYATTVSVGNGLLPLKDPAVRSYPLATLMPDTSGNIVVEIKFSPVSLNRKRGSWTCANRL